MDKLKEMKKNIKNIAIVALAVLVGGIVILSTRLINHKNTEMLSQEIARSMEYDQVQEGENIVQTVNGGENVANVRFDAFFLRDRNGDGHSESIRGACREVGSEDTLYMQLSVSAGELKNAQIEIQGKNFYLATSLPKDQQLKGNYISSNTRTIEFNTIPSETQRLLTGKVRSGDYSSTSKNAAIGNNIDNYSREDNKIILTGTYVDSNEIETQIKKEVPLTVDWHGTANAKITTTNILKNVTDFSSLYDSTHLNLSFNVQTAETTNALILQENELTGTIPALNGYMPTDVTVTGSNIRYTYNKETGEFRVTTEAVVNENNIVTTNAYTSQSGNTRYNSCKINISYPKEAYQETENQIITLNIPMQTKYKGYNNPDEEFFVNPYISNTASATVVATWQKNELEDQQTYSSKVDVQIGKHLGSPYNKYYISKEKPAKIYKGFSDEETEDRYLVSWYAMTGTDTNYTGLVLKENVNNSTSKIDTFVKSDSTETSLDGIASNVGIYYSNPANLLGNEGWIKVYNDETNDLLVTFNSSNWNNYTSNNPYMYAAPVKHIRVETSRTNNGSSIYIYNIKELNDTAITTTYGKEQFDAFEQIKTNLEVYLGENGTPSSDTAVAYYEEPYSIATLAISPNQIPTQETYQNAKITITARAANFMEQKWKNGAFIVKMPSDIMGMSVNSVNASDNTVRISAANLYKENGNYYLRIETQNATEAAYSITVDCNLTPNPKIATETETIELYAKNENGVQYFYGAQDAYDADSNGDTAETVHKSTLNLGFSAPNTLLTSQTATNYDNNNSETIAPQVAKVEKSQRTANIEITVANNNTNKITNVLIQGVIPFTGNKSVIGNTDLGSIFNATMHNTGIGVPGPLSSYTTVYYSTLERPTKDINDNANGWVTAENVADWSQIKTFIIDLGSYELNIGESRTFSYRINIPSDINYNDVSYSSHAVYFDLETDAGLYSLSTEVAKLGFMMVRKYDLIVTDYQKDTSKKLPGTAFNITEIGNESETIKKSTDANGEVTVSELYAERRYKLQETKISEDYALNSEEIEFYTYVDGNDNLILKYYNTSSDTYQDLTEKYSWVKSAAVTKEQGQNDKATIALENEVRAKLRITKTNGNSEALGDARFSLTGQGIDMRLVTNASGMASTSGLYLGQTYTLTETKATGYYLKDAITLVVTSTGSGFTPTVNGDATATVTTEDDIPIINLSIDDEPVPSYSLKVTTYEKHKEGVEDVKIAGAQYRLTGDGLTSNGVLLTTDENGEINIGGLYEYVDDNGSPKGGYTGVYTLTQIYATEGRSLDPTPIVFKAYRDNDSLTVETISGENRISSIQTITVTDANTSSPTVEFAIENSPIFNLKKKDEDGNPLAGAKFAIYALNDNSDVVGFAKDLNGEYIGELEGDANQQNIIGFGSAGENYGWTKKTNGVYYSNNLNVDNSTANMTSNIITLTETSTLKFKWTVSSQQTQDYAYYTITNVDTGTIVGGTGNTSSSKISGISYGTEYNDSLIWLDVTKNLPAGRYTLKFSYVKNANTNTGLDTAYVKDVSVGTATGYYAIATDENGEISLSLPKGAYKAVEIEAPEGFELAENEADRTQYFGIDDTKPAQVEFGVTLKTAVKGEGFNTINSTYATSDGGFVAVGSVYGQTDYISSNGRKDALIIKYSEDDTIDWVKNIGGSLGEEFKKVIQTSDGGYAAVGYFESETISVNNNNTITNNGARDGMLIKFDSSGNCLWGTVIGGALEDYAYSLCEDNSGNLIVTGGYFSTTLGFSGTETTLANSQDMFGYVAAFTDSGAFKWAQNLSNNVAVSGVQAVDVATVTVNDTENYVVAVNFWGTLTASGHNIENVAANTTNQDSAIIYYNTRGEYQNYVSISGEGNDDIRGIAIDSDGNMIVYGNRTNSTSTLTNTEGEATPVDATGNVGYLSAYVFRLTPAGRYIANKSFTFGTAANYNDEIMEVVPTKDKGLLIGGFTYSQALDIDGDGASDIKAAGDTNQNFSRGFIAELDKDNKVIAAYKQYLASYYQETRTVTQTADGGMVAAGIADGTEIRFDINPGEYDEKIAGLDAYSSDGFIVKYGNTELVPTIAEEAEVEFINNFQEYAITTTEYSVENGEEEAQRLYDTGATVTGTYTSPEVEAEHKKFVESVKFHKNGEQAITITPDTNYSVVGITINGEEYSYTASNVDGSVTIPALQDVTEDTNIVIKVNINMEEVKVNHYLWTEENGATTTSLADSETVTGRVGTQYQTSPKLDINYNIITNGDYYSGQDETTVKNTLGIVAWNDVGYENFDDFKANYYIPANASGTYAAGGTTVNYYYKEIKYSVTVKHLIAGTETQVPNKDTGNAVTDQVTENFSLGDAYTANTSEYVDYNTYEITTVNTTDENAVVNEETHQVTGTISANTTVTYYYQIKDGGAVTVHHYIAGTTTSVPSDTGDTVADDVITTVTEQSGERTAKIGDSYTTAAASNVAPNYTLATDQLPANANGTFTLATQEVIYYYKMVTPTLSNTVATTVNKATMTDEDADQSLTYTITYSGTVENYKGNITTTIVDTLPYEIDTTKAYSLNGGIYDAATRTITWRQVHSVDTYGNASSGTINLTKTITLTYANIPVTVGNLANTITANVNAVEANTTSETVNATAQTTFTHFRNLTVTNVWSDNNDERSTRPSSITVRLVGTVTNNDSSTMNVNLESLVPGIQTSVTLTNSTGSENGANWTYTWEQLPKYDGIGRLITYTVDAASSMNLNLYTPEVSGNMNDGYTITVYYAYEGNTERQTAVQYFDAEDGETPVSFEARQNGFTRRGYTFKNWRFESPTGPDYNEGAEVTFTPEVDSNQTNYKMYAIWE